MYSPINSYSRGTGPAQVSLSTTVTLLDFPKVKVGAFFKVVDRDCLNKTSPSANLETSNKATYIHHKATATAQDQKEKETITCIFSAVRSVESKPLSSTSCNTI